jgi:nitrilase
MSKLIAAAQFSPVFLNKNATVEKATGIIEECGQKGIDMVVFPEAFIPGYPDWIWLLPNSRSKELNELYRELVNNSVSVGDNACQQLCKSAAKNGVNVIIGINELNSEASSATLYNSTMLIDRKGDIVHVHRKLIPTGGERTVWGRGDGNTLKVSEISTGKVASLICWENLMPLARTTLYNQGVQVLAAPTWDKSESWIRSMQHIAREGGMYVISCCMPLRLDDIPENFSFRELYPEGREFINSGNSCIVGPNGNILAGPSEAKEELVIAEYDPDAIIAAKRMFDVSGHYSRPDVFDLKLKVPL